ncbi:MAG TPA: hypothetical protein VLJ42_00080 [Solirubrobacteraceae bacterium]|nr:hypothetical protein [Solirubrobacteraceae bacterium]
MSTGSVEAAGYALAYREAARGLKEQEKAVVELRTRSGGLISVAAIVMSFFGPRTLVRGASGAAGWVAIGCFVLLGFTVVLILWPRREWEFSMGPNEFIATYLEPEEGDALEPHAIERDLALHMGRSAEMNRRRLGMLAKAFRLAGLLLVAEVLAWVVALVIQG